MLFRDSRCFRSRHRPNIFVHNVQFDEAVIAAELASFARKPRHYFAY
jgi:hypothetical protein